MLSHAGSFYSVLSKHLERHGNEDYRVGLAWMQGARREMEDKTTIVLSLPHHPDIAFFGVFDGHMGSAAAQFLSHVLHDRIDALSNPFSPADLRQILLEACAPFASLFLLPSA